MEEKIKISLSKNTLDLLKKDCEDFRICKENAKPNMNAFINILITNYYENFSASEETLHQNVKKALEIVPKHYSEKVFIDIIKLFAKKTEGLEDKTPSTTISFKPTKVSEKAILYVEQVLLQSESISSFYRRLFISYSQKTKNEREKIIHKENYELLNKAIKNGVQVCVQLSSDKIINNLSIYSISASKDELFNYVLAYDTVNNVTVRLAKIKTVTLTPTPSNIPEENKELFDKQIACAPQYPVYPSDNKPIQVQLTEKGKALFERIYLYRPTPTSIEGDIYTFNCSANQVLYYFERFGEHALIISPKRTGIFMRNYYYYAYKKYKSIYKDS